MTFEEWLDECDRIDRALSGHGIYRPATFWREKFDAGRSPKGATVENYEGLISATSIDEAEGADSWRLYPK